MHFVKAEFCECCTLCFTINKYYIVKELKPEKGFSSELIRIALKVVSMQITK